MDFTKLALLPLSFALLFIVSCKDQRSPDDLPFIGLGEEGEQIIRYVPKGRYIKKFSGVMGDVSDKATEKLDEFEFEESWVLKRVSVGLQLAFEVEFTELFSWELEPSFELRFQKLKKPKTIL